MPTGVLTGVYRHGVDPKKRLFIPAKQREELGSSFMIVRDFRSPRLKMYSMEKWEEYIAPIRQLERKVAEATMLFLHEEAIVAEPDSQGRVILTPALLEYAGIEKDAVIVGGGDFAVIWSAEAYDAQKKSVDPDELRKILEGLGL